MAAFIYNFLSYIKSPPCRALRHAFNLEYPPILHKVLEPTYIEHFDEIIVIGDVHGCYDELNGLLNKADASSNRILKIFVGDLVGKGPKSCEVLQMVRTSASMLSVRGNHDEVALAEHFKSRDPSYVLDDRNLWTKNLTSDDISYLQNMPYTISIPSLNVVVVHAGLVPGIPMKQNCLSDMVTMRNLLEGDPVWNGGLVPTKHDKDGVPWASLWPGPSHIYFGHDAKRMLQQYEYATGLDTGCVYGNRLTGIFISGPRKGTYVSVDAMKIHKNIVPK